MNLQKAAIHAGLLGCFSSSCFAASPSCTDDGYAMHVLPDGFDPTAAYCNGIYPPNKDGDNASCFNHNWETPEARQRLWASCFQPGREVTRLFVSDMENRVVFLGKNTSGQCDAPLLALLSEAHELGIRVYALYSFNEPLITFAYPKQFNYHCGTSEAYFDGVAADSTFPGCNANIVDQQAYLDKLQDAVSGAAYTSPLPLHASASWDWDCDLLWPAVDGATKSVVEHMTDIVDSVDVQVASIENSAIVSRSMKSYQYWNSKVGKSDTSKVYVTAYTNPTEECQTSYSPHIIGSNTVEDNCLVGNPRTQAGMYQGFDDIESQLPLAKGAIYSMNEVYGSGITAGWPVHLMPNPAPASCSGVSGQCSDGSGLCSETDLSGCTCARHRNLLDQTKSSQARQHVKLRGSEIARPAQRKLAKPVKSPPPTSIPTNQQPPTPQPTDGPTAFECKCDFPPTPTPPTPAPCTIDGGDCTGNSQCCSGTCRTGGGPKANTCKAS